jgi:hypothetical protein
MAVAVSEPTPEILSTANAAQATAAFTPANDSLLVAFCFKTGTTTTPVASGGSLTWTVRATMNWTDDDAAAARASIYTAPVTTGASMQVQSSSSGDEGSGGFLQVFQVTGHNVATPVRQVDTGGSSGSSTAPTANFASALLSTSAYMAAYMRNGSNDPGSTPPTNWTEVSDGSYTVPSEFASAAFRAGGETGSSISFTLPASKTWYCQGIEIAVAGNAYTATLTGGMTPAGVMTKASTKVLAGAMTPAGVMTKARTMVLAGAINAVRMFGTLEIAGLLNRIIRAIALVRRMPIVHKPVGGDVGSSVDELILRSGGKPLILRGYSDATLLVRGQATSRIRSVALSRPAARGYHIESTEIRL